MAAILPNSIFFHIGRTGGYSVRDFLVDSKLYNGEVGTFHCSPEEIKAELLHVEQKNYFCFIRHPLTWLRSYWIHETVNGFNDPVVSDLDSKSFSDFCAAFIDKFPQGFTSHFFEGFTSNCNYVGKTEFLHEDLIKALTYAGEKFYPDKLYVPENNKSSSQDCIYEFSKASTKILEQVIEHNIRFCEEYGYNYIPSEMVDNSSPKNFYFNKPFFEELPPIDFLPSIQTENTKIDLSNTSFWIAENIYNAGCTKRDSYQKFKLMNSIDFYDQKVLDVGGGENVFAFYAALLGATNVHIIDSRIDKNEQLFSLLKKACNGENVVYENISVNDFTSKNRFNLVILFDVIECLLLPEIGLLKIKLCLEKNAKILISSVVLDDIYFENKDKDIFIDDRVFPSMEGLIRVKSSNRFLEFLAIYDIHPVSFQLREFGISRSSSSFLCKEFGLDFEKFHDPRVSPFKKLIGVFENRSDSDDFPWKYFRHLD